MLASFRLSYDLVFKWQALALLCSSLGHVAVVHDWLDAFHAPAVEGGLTFDKLYLFLRRGRLVPDERLKQLSRYLHSRWPTVLELGQDAFSDFRLFQVVKRVIMGHLLLHKRLIEQVASSFERWLDPRHLHVNTLCERVVNEGRRRAEVLGWKPIAISTHRRRTAGVLDWRLALQAWQHRVDVGVTVFVSLQLVLVHRFLDLGHRPLVLESLHLHDLRVK